MLDLAVVSLYCHSCTHAKASYGGGWAHTHSTEWKEQHTECKYTGTSGGMEADAAETLWSRSVDRHKFRYTTILSDGDSKTYKHLRALKVYGDCQRRVHQSRYKAVGDSPSNAVHSNQEEGSHSWGSRMGKADSFRHCMSP